MKKPNKAAANKFNTAVALRAGGEMLRQLNEVYASGMERGEKRLLRQMKAKLRRAAQDRW